MIEQVARELLAERRRGNLPRIVELEAKLTCLLAPDAVYLAPPFKIWCYDNGSISVQRWTGRHFQRQIIHATPSNTLSF